MKDETERGKRESKLVEADDLQAKGDPRGELIAVQSALLDTPGDEDLRARESELIAELTERVYVIAQRFVGWNDEVNYFGDGEQGGEYNAVRSAYRNREVAETIAAKLSLDLLSSSYSDYGMMGWTYDPHEMMDLTDKSVGELAASLREAGLEVPVTEDEDTLLRELWELRPSKDDGQRRLYWQAFEKMTLYEVREIELRPEDIVT